MAESARLCIKGIALSVQECHLLRPRLRLLLARIAQETEVVEKSYILLID